MFLEKWYADVVDENRVDVLYRANLRLGPAVLGYEGRITAGGRAHSLFVPGGLELPQEIGAAVVWPRSATAAGRSLRWADPHDRNLTLWHHDRQLLRWNPLVLNGAVSGAGLSPDARGYVENLTLNFGPWKLGLEHLRWGRFCGQRHSLVWIQWEGRITKQLAMVDGQACQLHEASNDRIRCAGAALRLTQPRPLVQESMAEGALRWLPLPRRLTAFGFLEGVETKWFARGLLELDGQDTDPGHAIFEEVVWS